MMKYKVGQKLLLLGGVYTIERVDTVDVSNTPYFARLRHGPALWLTSEEVENGVAEYNKKYPVGEQTSNQSFKVGDMVKIAGPLDKRWYEYVEDLENYVGTNGQVVCVERHLCGNNCKVQFPDDDWWFQAKSLQLVEKNAVEAIPPDRQENNMVVKPSHYQLFPEHGIEVIDITKKVLDRMEEASFDITLNEAGWYQQVLAYLLRADQKGGWQDIEKASFLLTKAIASQKERKNN